MSKNYKPGVMSKNHKPGDLVLYENEYHKACFRVEDFNYSTLRYKFCLVWRNGGIFVDADFESDFNHYFSMFKDSTRIISEEEFFALQLES